MEGRLLDLSAGSHVPAADLATRLLEEVGPSAVELGCASELERIGEIVASGTGSTRQLALADSLGGDLAALVRDGVVIGGT